MEGFLLTAFLFLIGGVVAVPIATRLGLGSVLGYLIAGIILGPVLKAFGVDVVSLQHFAEFGVVMMLFIVGLELEPRLLWDMRAKLLGLGGLQVSVTAALIAGFAILLGQPATVAIAIGLIFSLSSTAIALQTLNERGLMKSDGGQSSFAILLFQDIAVIPMLAVIPLLALPEVMEMVGVEAPHGDGVTVQAESHGDDHGGGHTDAHGADGHGDDHGSHGPSLSLVEGLPGWQQAAITLAAIAFVIGAGSFLTRPIFRYIAAAGLREIFIAAALLIVIGIALLMTLVGLSPALGTFLAGVVLANSEYRHELESDIDPFKGLLLGLFFMTVGALIDFDLLFSNFFAIIGLTVAAMLIKGVVLYGLAVLFRIEGSDKWLMAFALAQAGEFGFVLLSFSVNNGVIPQEVSNVLLLVVALSMLFTPLLFILFDRVIAPRYATGQLDDEADEIDMESPIIIAGHGRFGGIVNRVLRAAGYETVVLDHSSAQLEMLRAFGFKAFFGDATRPDLLHAAGIANAQLLAICIDDKEQATELTRYVSEHHPHVHIVARARDRNHVYDLYAAGCRDIIRETFDGGVRAGRSALEALGVHPFEAEQLARDFEIRDRQALAAMARVYDPAVPIHKNAEYVALARNIREQNEQEMRGERRGFSSKVDRGWHPPGMKDVEAAEAERPAEADPKKAV